MSAHTPGPWKWLPYNPESDEMPALEGADGQQVCSFGNDAQYDQSEGVAPNSADSALIAAAPDLLAACERAENEIIELLELDENSTNIPGCLLALRDAIAKARGQ